MLNARYSNDGKACIKLNSIQLEEKRHIDDYVASGFYTFESNTCVVCGCNDFEKLSEKDRYGLCLTVGICKECGLIQANPRMTQAAYNHFYTNYRRLYVGTEKPTEDYFQSRYRGGKATFDYLSEHVDIAGKSILEVGCGSGAILKYLHDSGATVKGIDLSSEYLSYGRERYAIDLSVSNLFDLPETQKFDIIIYSDVLEHILDPKCHLEKIKKLLKKDGVLYIRVPGIKNLFIPYFADFLKTLQNAHVYYFSLKTLKNLMHVNGYEMVCGDENIRSVWKLSNETQLKMNNEYEVSMTYLIKTEKKTFLRKVLPLALPVLQKTLNLIRKTNVVKNSADKK